MQLRPWRPLLLATSFTLAAVLVVPLAYASTTERASTSAGTTASGAGADTAATPKVAAAAARSRWLQPVTKITPVKGCNNLTAGMNGVKVKLVQRKLGFSKAKWETMDASTRAAVRRFQKRAHIPATGVVNNRTWKKMGFSRKFCSYDRWQARVTVREDATSAQRISHMIRYGRKYLGREYVWGGTGAYGQGIDCSGLVLQALYSSGLDPQPITVLKHVLPKYRTSLELYSHKKMRHIARRDARRGDLVFWRNNSTRRVNHVGIYLGSNRVLEASGSKVHIGRLNNRSTQTLMPKVVRPFA